MTQHIALALTLGVESVVCAIAIRRIRTQRPSLPSALIICIAASCLTHPFAWWLNASWAHHLGVWPAILCIESGVIAVECLIYRTALTLPWVTALRLASWTNAASFGFGLVIHHYGLLNMAQ